MLDFLKNNSNSVGHLIMSLAFMVFLGAVIIFVRDSTTVTFAVGLMTLLFGYWFGAQSVQIKHQTGDPAQVPLPPPPTQVDLQATLPRIPAIPKGQ